jgi:hypothetical protein
VNEKDAWTTTSTEGRRSAADIRVGAGIKKAVHVHNEIAHVSVIDCLLRLGFPRRVGARVIRINAHDVQLAEIPELDLVQSVSAAEDGEN